MVNDWDSLVDRLRRDFLHDDIEDDLWNQIKRRKQKGNESTVVFIAHLETLFGRLSRTPPEVSKVKHIRQNLLPEFISRLALENIASVSQLSDLCRKLEEADYIKGKIDCKSKQVPKNDVSEVNSTQEAKIFPSGSGTQLKNKFSGKPFNKNIQDSPARNHGARNNSKLRPKEVICWNCKLPNHTANDCKAPKALFCYKCGEPNVKVFSCPKCSKN